MQYTFSAKLNLLYNLSSGDALFMTQGIATFTLIGLSKIKQMAKQARHLSKCLLPYN
jgi:hypothetical protein